MAHAAEVRALLLQTDCAQAEAQVQVSADVPTALLRALSAGAVQRTALQALLRRVHAPVKWTDEEQPQTHRRPYDVPPVRVP